MSNVDEKNDAVLHEEFDIKCEAESEASDVDGIKVQAVKKEQSAVGDKVDGGIHECGTCGMVYKTAKGLKIHLGKTHGVKKEAYACDECGSVCSTKFTLQRHKAENCLVKVKRGRKVERHPCDECDKLFTSKIYLRHHKIRAHSGDNAHTFKCKECNYTSALSFDVRCHYKQVHLKRAKCELCPYACPSQSKLDIHMKTKHYKIKDLKCTECTFATSRIQNLNLHVRSVHEKKRPHKCQLCDYAASQKGSLRLHVARYHSEKKREFKVQCGICGDSFAMGWIQSHVEAEHPIVSPSNLSESSEKSQPDVE